MQHIRRKGTKRAGTLWARLYVIIADINPTGARWCIPDNTGKSLIAACSLECTVNILITLGVNNSSLKIRQLRCYVLGNDY